MHLTTRNVGTALVDFLKLFKHDGELDYVTGENKTIGIVKESSRNGNVLRIGEPVTITYTKPLERVLFNHVRDANPYALLYEALWMLAGRNDVASLAHYTKRFTEFSDDGKTLNGAYGYRWRKGEGMRDDPDPKTNEYTDQLDVLVAHLKANPTSRRAVLQMWNVEDDLLKIDSSRDVACNTEVMFSIRNERFERVEETSTEVTDRFHPGGRQLLDMTVINRSNDLIWGLLGANFVTFSILLEYMAARIGIQPGLYHHFSNNLHVYQDRPDWKPEEMLECDETDGDTYLAAGSEWPNPIPLVSDPEAFEEELPILVNHFDGTVKGPNPRIDELTEPFLRKVAAPMFRAYELRKIYREEETAIRMLDLIESPDWKLAATNWMKQRKYRREAKV